MTFFPGHLPTHPPTHLSPSSTQRKSTHTAGKNEAPENVTPPAWLFSLTYPPTHLPTSHRHARSGKPRTQQGKRDPRKCNASSVTFFPGPPTHLHTYTPLAFKHAAEKQISNAHFKREFTFILTCSLFFGMDLVAPGRTFSRQGQGKVARGSGTTCAKRACCIYLLNTNKR